MNVQDVISELSKLTRPGDVSQAVLLVSGDDADPFAIEFAVSEEHRDPVILFSKKHDAPLRKANELIALLRRVDSQFKVLVQGAISIPEPFAEKTDGRKMVGSDPEIGTFGTSLIFIRPKMTSPINLVVDKDPF